MPRSSPVKTTSTVPSPTPASSRSGASDVPVHSAVPTASTSHGWLSGRGSSSARPLPAHSIVTVTLARGRARRSSSVNVRRPAVLAGHLQLPCAGVDGRDVVVGQQVVEPHGRDVVAEDLEGEAVVAGGELQLLGREPSRLAELRALGRLHLHAPRSLSTCPYRGTDNSTKIVVGGDERRAGDRRRRRWWAGRATRSAAAPGDRRRLPRGRASSTIVGHGVDPALQPRLDDAGPRVLRPARRREGRDRHGARRPGVAGLVPGRRRADLGRPRPQGGHLLRRRARARRTRGSRAGTPLHGAEPVPRPTRPSCATAVLAYLDAHDRARPGRARAASRSGLGLDARLVRRPPHRRPARPVPHLPLPAGRRRPTERVGRRRAHRLRPAHDPRPGRHRRPRGPQPATAGSTSPPMPGRASSATSATCSSA